MRPMMKLFNQFEQVASATPFALRDDGNISDGIAQGTCTGISHSMPRSNPRDRQRSKKEKEKKKLGSERNFLLPQ